MNSKVSEYTDRQFAASGFVMIDHVIARMLTHDLIWASAQNALGDFTQARTRIREFLGTIGVPLYEVKFAAHDHWLLVGARSDDRLAERIHWITGLIVEDLRPYVPPAEAPAPARVAVVDEPPAHPGAVLAVRGGAPTMSLLAEVRAAGSAPTAEGFSA